MVATSDAIVQPPLSSRPHCVSTRPASGGDAHDRTPLLQSAANTAVTVTDKVATLCWGPSLRLHVDMVFVAPPPLGLQQARY